MKLAKTGLTVIPKIRTQNNWVYLGEKIFIDNVWIKINYFEIALILDNFNRITLSDHIDMRMSFNYNLIA